MDPLGENREFLQTVVPESASRKSSKRHPDSEMASISTEAQGFENVLDVVLNQGDGSTSGEKRESFKRKSAKESTLEVKNSKKRREEKVEAVNSIPEVHDIPKFAFGKAKKVAKKPTDNILKSKMDVDMKFPVKKTKMAFDVKMKIPQKVKEKKTKVALRFPVNKTKMAVDVNMKTPENSKDKKTKVAPKSPVKKTKAAEKAKGNKTKVAPKSPTKKTKMAANVKKTTAEKAKEKKTANFAAKKKTDANSVKKIQTKKPKTIKSKN